MNPWNILGWLIITILAFIIFFTTVVPVAILILGKIKHWQQRRKQASIPPLVGQVWDQDGSRLRITDIYESGRIGIKSGSASWSDSPEDFAQRRIARKLLLISGPTV